MVLHSLEKSNYVLQMLIIKVTSEDFFRKVI